MKKYLEKNTRNTILMFSFGFILSGFNPFIESLLLSYILNFKEIIYFIVFILSLFILLFTIIFFQKNAPGFRFLDDTKFISLKSFKLISLGFGVGFLINILNIYFIGIFQMLFL